jgi:hypothetical protein
MGGLQQASGGIELHPAEMVQRPAELVDTMARHAGRIQIGRAPTIDSKTTPLASPPAQGMVHVAEHHQGQPPLLLDLVDR